MKRATRDAASKVTPIEAERLVDDQSEIPWSDAADVIAVGQGTAGAYAAIEACAQMHADNAILGMGL